MPTLKLAASGLKPTPVAVPNRHLAYIDCVRGYAVLLVITCHLTYEYPALPWPVHRLTTMGWHGVQLFFLASAVTLMMSWHNEVGKRGSADIPAFFIRRYCRIAPAYYAAAALYYLITPPAAGFDAKQMAVSFLFVNSWTPDWTPTTAAWSVVPGGWSIGVEFTFYALFPLVAATITNLRRGAWLLFAALLTGAIANDAQHALLAERYEQNALRNFLYFWFPNQMVVFAIGMNLFLWLRALPAHIRALLTRYGNVMAAAALLGSFCVTYLDGASRLGVTAGMPAFLYACVAFACFIIAMAHARPGVLVNRAMAVTGQVSFSAYLLHFAVLHGLPAKFPGLFHTHATGLAAVLAFACAWLVVVCVTLVGAWCSFRLIERPGIALGLMLLERRKLRSQPTAAA